MEEGIGSSGILLPHRLVDELQRAATEAGKPALMGGEFARLAQSCQEVRHIVIGRMSAAVAVCGVGAHGVAEAGKPALVGAWRRAARRCAVSL